MLSDSLVSRVMYTVRVRVRKEKDGVTRETHWSDRPRQLRTGYTTWSTVDDASVTSHDQL